MNYSDDMEPYDVIPYPSDIPYDAQRPHGSTSPIFKRTSDFFFDPPYDSISASVSMRSTGSTVADSEYVAAEIKKYERERNLEDKKQTESKPTVYNLHIDKLVFDAKGQTEGMADANFMRQIISENLNSPTGSSAQFRELTKAEKIKRKLRQPRFYIPLSLLILIALAMSIALPIVLLNDDNKDPSDGTTTEPSTSSETETDDPATSSPTTSAPTTSATTTLTPSGEFEIVPRSDWLEYGGLDLSGKYKQLTPVKRVIILYIQTEDTCENNHNCKEFVAKHQNDAIPEFDDITENFVVGPDGKFYEGRGFNREGQTTYESLTSFNSKAISIGFLMKETDTTPSSNQTNGLCKFIERSLKNQDLDEDFRLYRHSALTSSVFSDLEEKPFEADSCGSDFKFELKWGSEMAAEIYKRKDWNATDLDEERDYLTRRISTKVIVATTGDDGCVEYEDCAKRVAELKKSTDDGEIEFNFVFAGTDARTFLFEIRGFDVAPPEENKYYFNGLWLLYIGNITTPDVGQALLEKITEFLDYGMEMGKVSLNYVLHGECQLREGTQSPGVVLYALMANHSHFGDMSTTGCPKVGTFEDFI